MSVTGIFKSPHVAASLAEAGGDVISSGFLQHFRHGHLRIVPIRALNAGKNVEYVPVLDSGSRLTMLDAYARSRAGGRRSVGRSEAGSDFGQPLESGRPDEIVFSGRLGIHHLDGGVGISEIIRIKDDEIRRGLGQNLMHQG